MAEDNVKIVNEAESTGKRGRLKAESTSAADESSIGHPVKKRRGRPPKPESERAKPKKEKVPGRGRGRPKKDPSAAPAKPPSKSQ